MDKIKEEVEQRKLQLAQDIRDLVRCLDSQECAEIKEAIIDIRIENMLKAVECIQNRGRAIEKLQFAKDNIGEILNELNMLRNQNKALRGAVDKVKKQRDALLLEDV